MSTVIDALFVELGLDNSGFKKGIKDSEKAQNDFSEKTSKLDKKQTEEQRKNDREKAKIHKEQLHRNKEVLEGMHKMREQLLGLLILFTGGKEIVDFIGDTIKATVSLGHMSDNIGVSVERLSGWRVAMQEIGGTAEEAAAMMDKAARSAVKGLEPTDARIGLLQMAGMTHTDISGADKDADSFVLAQAKVLKKMYDTMPAAKATSMAREILKLTTSELDLLKKGDIAVQQRVRHGAALSGQNEKQAKQAEKSLLVYTELIEKMSKAGRGILFDVLTALSEWYDKNGKEFDKLVKDFVEGIKNITPDSLEKVNLAFKVTAGLLEGILTTIKAIHDFAAGLGIAAGEVSRGDFSHVSPPLIVPGSLGASFVATQARLNANRQSSGGTTNNSPNNSKTLNLTVNSNGKDSHSIVNAIDAWWSN